MKEKHCRCTFRKLLRVGLIVLLLPVSSGRPALWAGTSTTTQTVSVSLGSASKLSVPSNLSLVRSGTAFSDFAGTLTVQYRARTSPAGGGNITLQPTGDFAPSGGPALANGGFHYVAGSAGLGTPASGVQTVRNGAQSPVVTIPPGACTGGGSPCSASDPASVGLNFTLENDASMSTGVYSIQLVFTISSI